MSCHADLLIVKGTLTYSEGIDKLFSYVPTNRCKSLNDYFIIFYQVVSYNFESFNLNIVFQAKKIFMVKGGYKTIRKALRSRGWVELDYYTKAAANGATNTASPYAKDTRLQQLTREGKSQLGRKETNQADGDDDDDDIDDVDDIEESESEEEKEDEEEYTMLVSDHPSAQQGRI